MWVPFRTSEWVRIGHTIISTILIQNEDLSIPVSLNSEGLLVIKPLSGWPISQYKSTDILRLYNPQLVHQSYLYRLSKLQFQYTCLVFKKKYIKRWNRYLGSTILISLIQLCSERGRNFVWQADASHFPLTLLTFHSFFRIHQLSFKQQYIREHLA